VIRPGQKEITVDIQATDEGGIPLDGKVAADFPQLYVSLGDHAQSIPLSLADIAVTDAWTEGGIVQKSGKGTFRLDLPDSVALVSLGEHDITIHGYASGFVVWEKFPVEYADAVIQAGTARNGPATGAFEFKSLRLAASEPGYDLTGKLVRLVRGTSAPDAQVAIGYGTVAGLSSVLTFGREWFTDKPDGSTEYEIVNTSQPALAQNARAAADLQSVNNDVDMVTFFENLADSILDRADAVETYTPRQILRGIFAALLAKTTNGQTRFRDGADSKDRITATINTNGDRSAVTLDLNE
jgi:hypothetical protein